MRNWKLYQAIKESKYESLRVFASALDVSPTYVGMVIDGTTNLNDNKVAEWAKLLGIPESVIRGK